MAQRLLKSFRETISLKTDRFKLHQNCLHELLPRARRKDQNLQNCILKFEKITDHQQKDDLRCCQTSAEVNNHVAVIPLVTSLSRITLSCPIECVYVFTYLLTITN